MEEKKLVDQNRIDVWLMICRFPLFRLWNNQIHIFISFYFEGGWFRASFIYFINMKIELIGLEWRQMCWMGLQLKFVRMYIEYSSMELS